MKKTFAIFSVCILCVFLVSCSDTVSSETNEGNPGSLEAVQKVRTENWPQFRGHNASGIAAGQDLPLNWDVKTGTNILWKKEIPGLGHSSPVVWEGRVFVTTTIGEGKEAYLKAVGGNVPAGLSRCEVSTNAGDPRVLATEFEAADSLTQLMDVPMHHGYLAALAVLGDHVDVQICDL